MAEFIEDTGSNGYRAELTEEYTADTANKTMTFDDAVGNANTGFTLPSSAAWLLVETYDVDDVVGAIGYTRYQNDVSQVDTDLAAYQTLVEAEVTAGSYTTYKIRATLFDGTSTAKVYSGDESTSLPAEASPSYTVTSYTPPTGSWKLTDTLTAPVEITDYAPIHLAFGDVTNTETPPSGVTINDIDDSTQRTAYSLVDEDNVASSVTVTLTVVNTTEQGKSTSIVTADQACLHDYQLFPHFECWEATDRKHITMNIYLPAGTWDIQSIAYGSRTDDDQTALHYFDGGRQTQDAAFRNENCAKWAQVTSTGQSFEFDVEAHYGRYSYWGFLNGMTIQRVQPIADALKTVYISLGDDQNTETKPDFMVNEINWSEKTDAWKLYDEDWRDSGISVTVDETNLGSNSGGDTPTGTACVDDYMMAKKWSCYNDTNRTDCDFDFTLPTGTWTLKVIGYRNGSGPYTGTFTWDYGQAGADAKDQNAAGNDTCLEWTGIGGDVTKTFRFANNSTNYFSYLNAIVWVQTSLSNPA